MKVKIKHCDVVLDLDDLDFDVFESLFEKDFTLGGLDARRMLIMGSTLIDEYETILKVIDYDFRYWDNRNKEWVCVEDFQIDCLYLEIEL